MFTATLKHRGSDEAALIFFGGRKQLHWTREDGGQGETLTIAVTIAQPAVDAMAGRYWRLVVDNFDMDHGMSAELTVRYDTLEGGAIRPLPSDASFEHTHWFAERLATGNGDARRQETAMAFGFDDWATLQAHVGWREPGLSAGVVHGRDMRFAHAQERFGNAIRAQDIAEYVASSVEMSDDLRVAVLDAGELAGASQHGAVDVEHLLFVLLDNPVTADVLAKCGVDRERLRSGLAASLESKDRGEEPGVSRALFGVLYVAELCSTLGHEACNSGNVLFGVFAEACRARDLLDSKVRARAMSSGASHTASPRFCPFRIAPTECCQAKSKRSCMPPMHPPTPGATKRSVWSTCCWACWRRRGITAGRTRTSRRSWSRCRHGRTVERGRRAR